ncbi:hypothetical protein J6590_020132 [Homalodisca vitripennis]|nr:hypothetical protein J6590_020132 [Homalodisca vitripennis]
MSKGSFIILSPYIVLNRCDLLWIGVYLTVAKCRNVRAAPYIRRKWRLIGRTCGLSAWRSRSALGTRLAAQPRTMTPTDFLPYVSVTIHKTSSAGDPRSRGVPHVNNCTEILLHSFSLRLLLKSRAYNSFVLAGNHSRRG